jgi:asparagine synthase (glutamine-hydrolysing)
MKLVRRKGGTLDAFITGSAGGARSGSRTNPAQRRARGHRPCRLVDQNTYLPEDVLVKVDRAALKNALEVRIPFLDRRIVDLVNSIPVHFKLRKGTTKYILRNVLADLVPPEVLHGPKRGFGIPIKHWFRSKLGDFFTRHAPLLDEQELAIPKPAAVHSVLDAHRKGGRDLSDRIWALLVLEECCRGVAP